MPLTPSFFRMENRAWKLVLYSRAFVPCPLSCILFFTRSSGCTKTVAPILDGQTGRERQAKRIKEVYNPGERETDLQTDVTVRQVLLYLN